MTTPSHLQNGNGTRPDSVVARASDVTTVRSQLSVEEMTRFVRWRMWGRPAGRTKSLKGLAIAVLLGVGGGALMEYLLGPTSVSLTVMLGLGLPLAIGFSLWRQATQLAHAYQKQAPQVYAPVSWTLQEDGILQQTAEQTSVREWRSIREIYSTHEFLIFELGEAQALLLPRRCFTTPAASQKFVEVARELWAAERHRVTTPPTEADLDAALGPGRVELFFETTPRDLLWLFRHATALFFRRQLWRVFVLTPLTLIMAVFFSLLFWRQGSVAMGIGAAIPLLGIPGLLFGLRPFLQARQYGKLPGMVGPHQVWASERGMIGYTPDSGIHRTEWSAYSRVRRLNNYLVFERGEGIHSAVPLRGQDPAVIDRILAWHGTALAIRPAPGATGNTNG